MDKLAKEENYTFVKMNTEIQRTVVHKSSGAVFVVLPQDNEKETTKKPVQQFKINQTSAICYDLNI